MIQRQLQFAFLVAKWQIHPWWIDSGVSVETFSLSFMFIRYFFARWCCADGRLMASCHPPSRHIGASTRSLLARQKIARSTWHLPGGGAAGADTKPHGHI